VGGREQRRKEEEKNIQAAGAHPALIT
jgi:hypothetical protein